MSAASSLAPPPAVAPLLRLHAPVCRRCGKKPPRPQKKGLCWSCYYTPGVRAQYPSLEPRGRRFEHEDVPAGVLPPAPPRPTQARPGSPAKRGVLCFRAGDNPDRLVYQLHHVYDERVTPAPAAVQKARLLFAETFHLPGEDDE